MKRQYKIPANRQESQEEHRERVMQAIRNSVDAIFDLLSQRLDRLQSDLS